MPFVDLVLEQFSQGNNDVIQACGKHLHFGYWNNPRSADGSVADFTNAAESLTKIVCDFSDIELSSSILDCGCGFGGTIASLNENFANKYLVGLNVDPRQLDRARTEVKSLNGNQITFIEADACQLPFEDSSFNLVFAIECIMHFSSRQRFFKEAYRVLKPGGKLILTDFLVTPFFSKIYESLLYQLSGQVKNGYTMTKYRKLASIEGLASLEEKDITKNIEPSYKVMINKILCSNSTYCNRLKIMSYLNYLGFIRYKVLSFKKLIDSNKTT